MLSYGNRDNFDIEKLIFRSNTVLPTFEYNCSLLRLLPSVQGIDTKRTISEFGVISVSVAGKTSVDRHRHDEEELFFVISGHATIEIEGNKASVVPGDSIYIPRYWYHQLANDDSEEFRFVDIYWDHKNRPIEEYESAANTTENLSA